MRSLSPAAFLKQRALPIHAVDTEIQGTKVGVSGLFWAYLLWASVMPKVALYICTKYQPFSLKLGRIEQRYWLAVIVPRVPAACCGAQDWRMNPLSLNGGIIYASVAALVEGEKLYYGRKR